MKKKNVTPLALASVFIMTIGYSCAEHKSESENEQAITQSDTIITLSEEVQNEIDGLSNEDVEFDIKDEISIETSQSYFLLEDTYSKNGYDFVVVDYVGEDGSNVNTKLRTFLIDDTFYTSSDYCGSFGKGFILSFEDVKNKLYGVTAYIEVEEGIVKCIDMNTAG